MKFNGIQILKTPSRVIIIILCLSPVVDMITGLLKYYMLPASTFLSVIYKAVICCICIYLFVTKNNGRIKTNIYIKLYALITFIICAIFFHSSKAFKLSAIVADISEYMKLALPLLLYYVLQNLIKKNYIGVKDVKKIMEFYMWFVPLSIIVPKFLGIGFYTYGLQESGYRGFYFGGNGINILEAQLMFYSGWNIVRGEKKAENYILLILNMIATAFIGTKTSIISVFLFAGILIMYPMMYRKKISRSIAVIFVLLIVAALFTLKNQYLIESVINRLDYEYRRVDGNLLDFLTNSRIKQMFPTVETLLGDGNIILNIIFGAGFCKYIKVVEMDFVDIFIHFGIVMFFIIAGFYFNCFKKCKSIYFKMVLLFALSYGCMAGHLLISPMGNMALSMIAVIGYHQNAEKRVSCWGWVYEKYCDI